MADNETQSARFALAGRVNATAKDVRFTAGCANPVDLDGSGRTRGYWGHDLGASLHSDYSVKRGSLRANWFRREARNRLYGTYTVRFQDGDLGWGCARVTEWPTSWRSFYRINW